MVGLAVRGEPVLHPCGEGPSWEFNTTGTDEDKTTNLIVKYSVVTKPSFY